MVALFGFTNAATGVFLYGSLRTHIEGNYVHHTYADLALSHGAAHGGRSLGHSAERPEQRGPIPTLANVKVKDTSVMRTRDNSFVAAGFRMGLYRIHVRHAPAGGGYQQRFEYAVKGSPTEVRSRVTGVERAL